MSAAIVWFRNDLRTADQPALREACDRKQPVIPVYIDDPEEEGDWPAGGASKAWLSSSLKALDADLRERGSRLIVRKGPTLETLKKLLHESGADAVYWNRRYEPAAIARDAKIKESLKKACTTVASFNASLLFEPWTIQTGTGTPFRVFTPFWRKCLAGEPPAEPLSDPKEIPAPARWPASLTVDERKLRPSIDWDKEIHATWEPGVAGAKGALKRLQASLADYATERDRPDHEGTSRLSPYLHFGEISPRQVWHAIERAARREGRGGDDAVAEPYLRQLIWREFAYHLLYHCPHTATEPLQSKFADFPWDEQPAALRAWQQGRTGFPYIDAGMRQLWRTGWMHNRVRMAVASFLVKDLLIPWQAGARWFWDTLVDADLANNTLGWQWTAGCGADAAPFFRIFNPVSQGEKFDPEGSYVRRWVPELSRLPAKWIHAPWKAPAEELEEAGIELGADYPLPIIDHDVARKRALAALQRMSKNRT